ncbi:MAG: N-formylglutamate amidohydrolase [Gammaproteobacteria bacterium]|nr:N-formylglutamate amidohydrolase [Gammaproteobacteria bacterium]
MALSAHSDSQSSPSLLAADKSSPVWVLRASGTSPYVLLVDHASCAVPRQLADLGLSAPELRRHIAWDLGAAEVALRLSALLDAALLMQRYSRLVIDCNRPLHSDQSIVTVSDGTVIPGNASVNSTDAARRARDIFEPYHAAIAALLDDRARRGTPSALVAIHSFTPIRDGRRRPWQVGVLYNRDPRLATALGRALETDGDLVVGYNEPYDLSDQTDWTIPEHGERRGLPHVELEIRQDLIADSAGQQQWAVRLARLLPPLLASL